MYTYANETKGERKREKGNIDANEGYRCGGIVGRKETRKAGQRRAEKQGEEYVIGMHTCEMRRSPWGLR